MEKQYNWFFTFGCGQKYPNGYVKIFGTSSGAREEMFKRYGPHWSFQYGEEEFEPICKRWNMYEVKES